MATIGNSKAQKHIPIRLSTTEKKNDKFGLMGVENNFTIESLTEDIITAARKTLGTRISEAEVNQIRSQVNTDLRMKYGIEAKPPDTNWVPIEDAAKRLGIDNRSVRRIVQKIEAPTQSLPQLVQKANMTYVHLPTLIDYREQFGRAGRPKQNLELTNFSEASKKKLSGRS